jgi:hypothetical protein
MEQALSVRAKAEEVESVVMNWVFPSVIKRPYSIRTYKNLATFVDAVEHKRKLEDICLPGADKAYMELPQGTRDAIKAKIGDISAQFSGFVAIIGNVKKAAVKYAHPTDVTEKGLLEALRASEDERAHETAEDIEDILKVRDYVVTKTQ